jgi:hypothetical protein
LNSGIRDTTLVAGHFTLPWQIGRNSGTSLLKIKMNMAIEGNGEAKMGSRGKDDHAATDSRRGFNCAVYGHSIERLAIRCGAERTHFEPDLEG